MQLLVGKLFSRNETKHVRAQVGMKFVSSLFKEINASVGLEYTNSIITRNRRRRLGQHNAILIECTGDC